MFTATASKRRWFQFTIRTFLALMVLVAVILGWWVRRVHRQRRAVATVEQLHGVVVYDYQARGDREPPGPAWLRKLVGEEFFTAVAVVKINPGSRVFQAVAGTNTGVPVSDTKIHLTDDDLEAICAVAELKHLDLSGTDVGDRDVPRLGRMESLVTLYLDGGVSPKGMATIRGLLPRTRID